MACKPKPLLVCYLKDWKAHFGAHMAIVQKTTKVSYPEINMKGS